MADFKDEISPALVDALAEELGRASPGFAVAAFREDALQGLEERELMARVRHVAEALRPRLPRSPAELTALVDGALASATFTGWMTLPVTFAVAAHAPDEPDIALPLLARLSPRFTSEGAVRPFIERAPDVAFRHLREWAGDPDEHVRRLASEGTRPRLPWASRLPSLIADPSPALELLDRLHDDASDYVRRSVANHLNDIAKDHPELAVATARRWLVDGSERTRWTVRHGLRTLVKQGDPHALALLGFDPAAPVRLARLDATPRRLPIGGVVELAVDLVADAPASVAVDYRVHHMGARGPRGAKVFKLTTRTLAAGRTERIRRRHAFRPVSVRRLYPGPHRVEIQVNGRVLGEVVVELTEPAPDGAAATGRTSLA